jgi:hypothetical protein
VSQLEAAGAEVEVYLTDESVQRRSNSKRLSVIIDTENEESVVQHVHDLTTVTETYDGAKKSACWVSLGQLYPGIMA